MGRDSHRTSAGRGEQLSPWSLGLSGPSYDGRELSQLILDFLCALN